MNKRRDFWEKLNTAVREEAGVAYIEFALCVGVLLVMFFGAIEVSRYVLIVQKVEKTIDTLADVLSQSDDTVSSDTIAQYLSAAPQLMQPYSFGSNGIVILTGIVPNGGVPTISWQVCGGGTLVAHSALGSTVGAAANLPLPQGFVMNTTEDYEVVFGEIFYNYTPMLKQSVVNPAQIYRVATFRPRFGTFNVTTTGVTCP